MEKSLSLLKAKNENYYFGENQTGFRCNKCGGAFQKPILATVPSGDSVQTYYACPHCLAKVSKMKERKSRESKKTSTSTKENKKDNKKVAEKLEKNVTCKHFIGYLKKRPKNIPIPEECLTRNKMMECLLH